MDGSLLHHEPFFLSGVVEEKGAQCTDDINVGDQVFGAAKGGCLAEYAVCATGKVLEVFVEENHFIEILINTSN